MNNQESIHQILESTLNEIRAKYGMALYTIEVEWIGTVDKPACAITKVEVRGLSYPPIDRDGQ